MRWFISALSTLFFMATAQSAQLTLKGEFAKEFQVSLKVVAIATRTDRAGCDQSRNPNNYKKESTITLNRRMDDSFNTRIDFSKLEGGWCQRELKQGYFQIVYTSTNPQMVKTHYFIFQPSQGADPLTEAFKGYCKTSGEVQLCLWQYGDEQVSYLYFDPYKDQELEFHLFSNN